MFYFSPINSVQLQKLIFFAMQKHFNVFCYATKKFKKKYNNFTNRMKTTLIKLKLRVVCLVFKPFLL